MASTNLNGWLPLRSAVSAGASSAQPPQAPRTAISRRAALFTAWMGMDIVAIAVVAVLATYLRRNTSLFQPNHPTELGASSWSIALYFGGFALALVLISKAYGLYGSLHTVSALHEQRLTVQSCLTASLVLAGALYFTRATSISRAVVIVTLSASTLLICMRRALWRLVLYRRYEKNIGTRNIVIVGIGPSAIALRNHLRCLRRLGYTFKGFLWIDQDSSSCEDTTENLSPDEIIGGIDELKALVRQHFVDELFITSTCSRATTKALIAQAIAVGIDVRVIPELYDGVLIHAPIEYVGEFPTISFHVRYVPVAGYFVKRVLDIMIASVSVLALAPLMLCIALAIRLNSKGPTFYCAERVGRKGQVFRCWKFRSMVPEADQLQANVLHMNERDSILFKIKHDPRITAVGRFLRKYSLDELPQLFNVLLGNMSIVGPRPPLLGEVLQYKPEHLRRLNVCPGMTGLWQVQARQDPSFDQYISLDTLYLDNWSLWLDFKIIIRTIGVVMAGTGA